MAGNKNHSNLVNSIDKTYKKHNREDEYEIVVTESRDHGQRAALEFSERVKGEKLVIIAGGDGSLGEIAQVLGGTETALGLIPTGTANDFAKNFDYSNFSIEDSFEPVIKNIDLMEVNGRKCINVMSLGFDTHVLNSTYELLAKSPKLGKKAFILGVIKNLVDLKSERLKLHLKLKDGQSISIENEFIIFALCNGGYYGSGFNPAPKSSLDDGYLNLILAKKLNYLELFPLIFKYKKGKHLGHKKISEYITSSGTISSDKEFIYNLDGEIYTSNKLEFKVLKNNLRWAYLTKKI